MDLEGEENGILLNAGQKKALKLVYVSVCHWAELSYCHCLMEYLE